MTTPKRTWNRRLEAYVDEDLHQAAAAAAWRARLSLSQWLKAIVLRELEKEHEQKAQR